MLYRLTRNPQPATLGVDMFARRTAANVLVILALTTGAWGGSPAASGNLPKEGTVRFVADGDTVILETGEKVRYLGIDAPEVGHGGEPSECYGQESKKANSEMVLGKKVTLSYGRRTQDHYGRLLAFVHGPDGNFVNLELIKSGNAHIYRDNERLEFYPVFLQAQREAIGERRGLWGMCRVKPAAFYLGNRDSHVFHRPGCRLAREMSAPGRVRFADRWAALYKGYRPCRVCAP
jgi:micrococcal nuclease